MTVLARKFISVPARTATVTWKAISDLLAPDETSPAARALDAISGIASSLITREAMTSPIVIFGSGPRVRVYCLYNEAAIEGDDANESALPFSATAGDWSLSLPCPADDLAWVQRALREKSNRISARDMDSAVDEESTTDNAAKTSVIDFEGFFKS